MKNINLVTGNTNQSSPLENNVDNENDNESYDDDIADFASNFDD